VSALSPSFSTFMERIQDADGSFRSTHAKIAEYVEEIEFFKGGTVEKDVLNKQYTEFEVLF
jgi:ABC-type uncharacterized transport system fused permease/ATPase subunit